MSFFKRFFNKGERETVTFAGSVELAWDDYFWAGQTNLPAWAGFQDRQGAYASESSDKPSKGDVQISVSGEKAAPPTPAQAAAFVYLRDHGNAVRDAVLKALFDHYMKVREHYEEHLGDEFETLMPVLQSPKDLVPIIGLSTVHIISVEKGGCAYVGFEFGCEWEEEHGLGVMTHRDRVIEVGEAEESFSQHRAQEDSGVA